MKIISEQWERKNIRGVRMGENVRISGVTIEEGVFIGRGVIFITDKRPRATNAVDDWTALLTLVKRGVSIGPNGTIFPGITISENALVGGHVPEAAGYPAVEAARARAYQPPLR